MTHPVIHPFNLSKVTLPVFFSSNRDDIYQLAHLFLQIQLAAMVVDLFREMAKR